MLEVSRSLMVALSHYASLKGDDDLQQRENALEALDLALWEISELASALRALRAAVSSGARPSILPPPSTDG